MPATLCPSTAASTSPTRMRPSLAAALPTMTSSTTHSPPSMPCTKKSPTPAFLLCSRSCFRPAAAAATPAPRSEPPPGDLLCGAGCCRFPLTCAAGSLHAPLTASTLHTAGSARQLSVDSHSSWCWCPRACSALSNPRFSDAAHTPFDRNDECGTPATTSRPTDAVPTVVPLGSGIGSSRGESLGPSPLVWRGLLDGGWVPGAASATSLHTAERCDRDVEADTIPFLR
mmetsp:Transcript_3084/g.7839  ORF Transcript_3084/g.7839 Transcript_3084/m.7839 type:complete len:228 (+) Transcript_3084:1034-1717(+)